MDLQYFHEIFGQVLLDIASTICGDNFNQLADIF